MLNRTRILVRGLIPLTCVLTLGACGQTGPLFLPKVPPKVSPASSTTPLPATKASDTTPAP
ncbi:LPS translocon maturation chaperone LptM [Rhodoferax mekongensis]|uniref:LPS translocon maturation chaperone LptM n=1 Tax=Rhodoferax mekongensis TaxID=3068341 RepID=UPI003D173338